MYLIISALSLLAAVRGQVAELGTSCVTPNGENATCISINNCRVIQVAISYLDKEAIDFARKSQCGHDGSTPLVCCGTIGHLTTQAPPKPTTVKPSRPAATTPPAPLDSVFLPDNSLCGIQENQKQDRIFGGAVTDITEFPWMVALKYERPDGTDGGYRCGGTLINREFVLTAAQCLHIKGFTLTGARLGEWKFSTVEDCSVDTDYNELCADPVVDLKIAQKIPHPYYSRRSGNNDIALLRLERKVQYTAYIRPICLPPTELLEPAPGTLMDIAGWGITETGDESDVKLKVQIPMLANEKCRSIFTNYTHVNPNQACAGGEEGKDACHGDAGGPLMTTYIKRVSKKTISGTKKGLFIEESVVDVPEFRVFIPEFLDTQFGF